MDFGQFSYTLIEKFVQVDYYFMHRFLAGFVFQVDCPLTPPVEKHLYGMYTKYFVRTHFVYPSIFRSVILLTIKNIG